MAAGNTQPRAKREEHATTPIAIFAIPSSRTTIHDSEVFSPRIVSAVYLGLTICRIPATRSLIPTLQNTNQRPIRDQIATPP